MLFWILWILGGLIFCRCPLFFYPTSDLPDLSAAPAYARSRIVEKLTIPPLLSQGWKKCEIWPQFSTPFTSESSSF